MAAGEATPFAALRDVPPGAGPLHRLISAYSNTNSKLPLNNRAARRRETCLSVVPLSISGAWGLQLFTQPENATAGPVPVGR